MDRRSFLTIILVVIESASIGAQIDRFHSFIALDNNGIPMPAARLCSFEAGTTVMKSTYRTSDLKVHNPNPVLMDYHGTATIYLGQGRYRFALLRPRSTANCTDLGQHFFHADLLWLKANVAWEVDQVAAR